MTIIVQALSPILFNGDRVAVHLLPDGALRKSPQNKSITAASLGTQRAERATALKDHSKKFPPLAHIVEPENKGITLEIENLQYTLGTK